MTDTRAPANKLAMSKALGAAFLNHQVEQLEKSVSGNGPTGNWRDRRSRAPPATQEYARAGNGNGNYNNSRRPASGGGPRAARAKGGAADRPESTFSEGRERTRGEWDREKDADIVVVDASVLVHALPQVKKWCRDGRQEVVIVPLEALNTLDLLKKGSTQLAQRARAASRILEAQVGTNPRIRVQRDDAFVLWDSIPFRELPATATTVGSVPSPEWVRRTVCCARWEFEHSSPSSTPASDSDDSKKKKKPKIILAVLASSPDDTPTAAQAQDAPISASPVPLPAPQPNRFEPRAAGMFVAHWAARAGVELFRVSPMSLSDTHGHGGHGGRRSPEDERATRGAAGAFANGGNSNGTYGGGDFPRPGNGGGGRGRRNSHHRDGGRATTPNSHGGGGLVERPPAVMAMMEMVSQPSRVVRVLARGEKLDPN